MKSVFVTFEGIEACGKSTQARLLNNFLLEDGYEVLLTREPGGPAISEKIRHILLDNANSEMVAETEILLYMASRAQHTAQWIIPALKNNCIVICDRYYDSTYAYQGAARKISSDNIQMINKYATFNLVPDVTFYLNIPLELSLQRLTDKKQDRLENESRDFHQAVKEGFDKLALENPKRFIVIDGTQDIESIHNKIKEILLSKIQEG